MESTTVSGNAWNSGLTKFEAPDPSYWCAHGYAVCNPDMRGIAHSEGNTTMVGSQEDQDGYDLIEWTLWIMYNSEQNSSKENI